MLVTTDLKYSIIYNRSKNMANLGINLTKYISDLYTENYIMLLRNYRRPKKKRKYIQCSWIGQFSNNMLRVSILTDK